MGEFRVGVKAVIIYERKVLLIKKVSAEGGNWELPGGLMEFGEDLHTALRREIIEETGLQEIHIDKLIYAMTVKVSPVRQIVGIGYLGYANSDMVKLSSDEHTDFTWADKKELLSLLDEQMLSILKENIDINSLEID